jgi:hypothetical protein
MKHHCQRIRNLLAACLISTLAGCASGPIQSTENHPVVKPTELSFGQQFEAAVAKGSWSEFNRLISQSLSSRKLTRRTLLAELEKKVGHPQIWVRVEVLGLMYRLKEFSGQEELMRIARMSEPAWYPSGYLGTGRPDAREQAALVLGRCGDVAGTPAVLEAYRRSPSSSLLQSLVYLGAPEAIGFLRQVSAAADRIPPAYDVAWFGYVGTPADLPFLRQFMQAEGRSADRRLAAAWAITRISTDEKASVLIRKEAEALLATNMGAGDLVRNVPYYARLVGYLGTQKDEASVRLLERVALDVKHPHLRLVALCNLAHNHADRSHVGRDAIVKAASLDPQVRKDGIPFMLAFKIAHAAPPERFATERANLRRIRVGSVPWSLYGDTQLFGYVLNAPYGEPMTPYFITNHDSHRD